MKRYILFSEEELIDLGRGDEIALEVSGGEILYFMCRERFVELCEEQEDILDEDT